MARFRRKQGPRKTLERLMANDETLTAVDLSSNVSFQMNALNYATQFNAALRINTHLVSLNLSDCGLMNAAVVEIAEGLAHNAALTELDLSNNNKFDNQGLQALGSALETNTTLVQLNVIGHKGRVGEATLTTFANALQNNHTLENISWRLQSRQSFSINNLLTRNKFARRQGRAGATTADGGEGTSTAAIATTATAATATAATATPSVEVAVADSTPAAPVSADDAPAATASGAVAEALTAGVAIDVVNLDSTSASAAPATIVTGDGGPISSPRGATGVLPSPSRRPPEPRFPTGGLSSRSPQPVDFPDSQAFPATTGGDDDDDGIVIEEADFEWGTQGYPFVPLAIEPAPVRREGSRIVVNKYAEGEPIGGDTDILRAASTGDAAFFEDGSVDVSVQAERGMVTAKEVEDQAANYATIARNRNMPEMRLSDEHKTLLDGDETFDCEGATPLMLAILGGHFDLAMRIMEIGRSQGRSMKETIDRGTGALHFAAECGHTGICQALVNDFGHNGLKRGSERLMAALHFACKTDNVELVEFFVERCGTDINYRSGESEVTPLIVAAEFGAHDVFDWLVLHGADVKLRLSNGADAFVVACEAGRLRMVKKILKINRWAFTAQCNDNTTGLWAAAMCGHLDVVNLVLSTNEPKLNVRRSGDNTTALCIAATHGHYDVVVALVGAGADPNIATTAGSALYLAANYGHLEVVQFLVREAGISDINATVSGWSALMVAAYNNHYEVVRYLAAEGASFGFSVEADTTPLCQAAIHGFRETVRVLAVELGADLEQKGNNHHTPLGFAIANGYAQVAIDLIRAGANVNACNEASGEPLVLMALQKGKQFDYDDLVDTLIKCGANLNGVNKSGFSALHMVAQGGMARVLDRLLATGGIDIDQATPFGLTPTFIAAQHGHLDCVSRLVGAGADINATSRNGFTPLIIACEEGKADVALWLIEHGADFNQVCADGSTALYLAAKMALEPVVEVLIAKGVDVDAGPPDSHHTPFYRAVCSRALSIAKKLVAAGADISGSPEADVTPVFAAAEKDYPEILEWLVGNGSDYMRPTGDGTTPLMAAASRNNTVCVRILVTRPHIELEARRPDGHSALTLADGNKEVTLILVAAGAKLITAVFGAIQTGKVALALQIIAGAPIEDINAPDPTPGGEGWTMLTWSYAQRANMVYKVLIAREGIDLDARAGPEGTTVLVMAANRGDVEMVTALLQHGANVNVCRDDGCSPLHAAVAAGLDVTVVRPLILAGADLSARFEKLTPRMMAQKQGSPLADEFGRAETSAYGRVDAMAELLRTARQEAMRYKHLMIAAEREAAEARQQASA